MALLFQRQDRGRNQDIGLFCLLNDKKIVSAAKSISWFLLLDPYYIFCLALSSKYLLIVLTVRF